MFLSKTLHLRLSTVSPKKTGLHDNMTEELLTRKQIINTNQPPIQIALFFLKKFWIEKSLMKLKNDCVFYWNCFSEQLIN